MPLEQLIRLDNAEVAAYQRQLEDFEQDTDKFDYPELPFAQGRIVPLDIQNKPWAESYTYRQITYIGGFQLARNYTTAIPTVEALYDEFTQKIHQYNSGYHYTDRDIAAVARMGESLEPEKVYGVREAAEQTLNSLIALGDRRLNAPGFITHPDAMRSEAAYPLNSLSTSAQQLAVLNESVHFVVNTTNQVEKPDTLLLPISVKNFLNNQLIQTGTSILNKTVLEHFLQTNGYIRNIEGLNELEGSYLEKNGYPNKSLMIAYSRNRTKVKAKIYQPLTFLESRRSGVSGWSRPALFRYGWVQLRRPRSMHVVELPES